MSLLCPAQHVAERRDPPRVAVPETRAWNQPVWEDLHGLLRGKATHVSMLDEQVDTACLSVQWRFLSLRVRTPATTWRDAWARR